MNALLAIPSMAPGGLDASVSAHFGHCDAFTLVARLMQQNALIFTAVVSGLSEADFHEAGEGLGILLALPRHPGAAEAGQVLAALKAVA